MFQQPSLSTLDICEEAHAFLPRDFDCKPCKSYHQPGPNDGASRYSMANVSQEADRAEDSHRGASHSSPHVEQGAALDVRVQLCNESACITA
eukprot:CAMPEP_0203891430 /NCGR_PEP_ID=MMETSP0359-20131031/34713_1 /ASSEMBLY_ACC=CAM_ASM_000338 /TAXON_ID=268821 /ORGANISM="Scrippsiella Hangoei, Strain SHTV-5" /LENGTH=91 /DNA_ID=CAMNT_0050813215 /DNA_START=150 /DNA_END=425 /DNA_ORIENTATION=+